MNYRNFSYPIVAQTEKRREKLKMKFQESGSHYGNHYSSLATTLIFLFRIEPYSKMHIKLFDGHFDTDRLMISISKLFDNLSATPIELIPEFFFLHQFLLNINQLDYGKRRDGNIVNNIELPPWCNNNPRLFVDMNMRALESKYVSEHLNEWIDLIFGYKQKGKAAEEACNIYPSSSYDSGDISKLSEKEKLTLKIKIQNFGQTPLQLFRYPHPKREVKETNYNIGIFEKNKKVFSMKFIQKNNKKIKTMKIQDKIQYKLKKQNECYLQNGIITSEIGGIIKIERNNKIIYIEECDEGKILECNERILIVGGKNGSVQIIDIFNEIPKKKGRLNGNSNEITCCKICSHHNLILTADENGNVLIWDIRTLMCLHSISLKYKIIDLNFNDEIGTIVILTEHQFYYYDLNGELINESVFNENQLFTSIAITQNPMWCFKTFIVTGNYDGLIQFWKITKNYSIKLINSFNTYPYPINDIKIIDNNNSLLINYYNDVIINFC